MTFNAGVSDLDLCKICLRYLIVFISDPDLGRIAPSRKGDITICNGDKAPSVPLDIIT